MLNHKQMVVVAGAAVLVSALAMVPRDANAWAVRGFRIPIDIIERVAPPGHRAPTEDAAVRRSTTVKSGVRATVSAVRRAGR